MKMKKKFMKGLAVSMAFSMLFTTNAFATPIDLANSEMDVKTDTLDKSTGTDYFADEENEWQDGTINEEVRVIVDLASQFEITIPKEIVLDGEDGTAQYKVKAVGDIAGDQKLSVIPDPDFVLSEAGGKADVIATVTQPDTEYIYTDLQGDGTEYDGSIAATLTAGEWSGKFNFNIKFDGGEVNLENDKKYTVTLFEGIDELCSEMFMMEMSLPYNVKNIDDKWYMKDYFEMATFMRYDIESVEKQTIKLNYNIYQPAGMFTININPKNETDEAELGLERPGEVSDYLEIELEEGINHVYIMTMQPREEATLNNYYSIDFE